MSQTRWRITFANGDTELTPENADKIGTDVSGRLLLARASRTYGPDEVVATYPMANIRKYERVVQT